jgi:hypothetical protein
MRPSCEDLLKTTLPALSSDLPSLAPFPLQRPPLSSALPFPAPSPSQHPTLFSATFPFVKYVGSHFFSTVKMTNFYSIAEIIVGNFRDLPLEGKLAALILWLEIIYSTSTKNGHILLCPVNLQGTLFWIYAKTHLLIQNLLSFCCIFTN